LLSGMPRSEKDTMTSTIVSDETKKIEKPGRYRPNKYFC
jgi:hypothetical protein